MKSDNTEVREMNAVDYRDNFSELAEMGVSNLRREW